MASCVVDDGEDLPMVEFIMKELSTDIQPMEPGQFVPILYCTFFRYTTEPALLTSQGPLLSRETKTNCDKIALVCLNKVERNMRDPIILSFNKGKFKAYIKFATQLNGILVISHSDTDIIAPMGFLLYSIDTFFEGTESQIAGTLGELLYSYNSLLPDMRAQDVKPGCIKPVLANRYDCDNLLITPIEEILSPGETLEEAMYGFSKHVDYITEDRFARKRSAVLLQNMQEKASQHVSFFKRNKKSLGVVCCHIISSWVFCSICYFYCLFFCAVILAAAIYILVTATIQ